jgi:hypothetical protein
VGTWFFWFFKEPLVSSISPPKKQHQRTASFGYIKKSGIKKPASLGILKTPESKNLQLWVFQNPKRTASFHERPTGSFQVLWLVNCSQGWFWGQVPQINFLLFFGSIRAVRVSWKGETARDIPIYISGLKPEKNRRCLRKNRPAPLLPHTNSPNPQPPLPS